MGLNYYRLTIAKKAEALELARQAHERNRTLFPPLLERELERCRRLMAKWNIRSGWINPLETERGALINRANYRGITQAEAVDKWVRAGGRGPNPIREFEKRNRARKTLGMPPLHWREFAPRRPVGISREQRLELLRDERKRRSRAVRQGEVPSPQMAQRITKRSQIEAWVMAGKPTDAVPECVLEQRRRAVEANARYRERVKLGLAPGTRGKRRGSQAGSKAAARRAELVGLVDWSPAGEIPSPPQWLKETLDKGTAGA